MRHRRFPGVVRPAAFAFLTLAAGLLVVTVLQATGAVGLEASRRALGVLIGLMAIVTGNFLPKIRPLDALNDATTGVSAAERAAGWILIAAGVSFVALFLAAPLALARALAPIAGFASLGAIALDWIALLIRSAVGGRHAPAGPPEPGTRERRASAIWLLFAFVYVFATACLKFIADSQPWARGIATWSFLGFSLGYAVVLPLASSRERPWRRIAWHFRGWGRT